MHSPYRCEGCLSERRPGKTLPFTNSQRPKTVTVTTVGPGVIEGAPEPPALELIYPARESYARGVEAVP
jgi:hypothetical protein